MTAATADVQRKNTLQTRAESEHANVHTDSDAASNSVSLSASACRRKCVVDATYSPEPSSGFPRLVEKLLVEEEENEEEEEEEEEKEEMVLRGSVEEKVGWGMELG